MSNQQEPVFGHGKICYLVMPASDIDVSAKFYETVFNWKIRDDNGGNKSFDDGVGGVSGTWVKGLPAETNPRMEVHIMVDDAAATLKAITTHGGKIISPIDDNAPETTARFADPAGNVLGIYQHRG